MTQTSTTGSVLTLVAWVLEIGTHLWNRGFRQGRTGQSVGKQVLGIRLISDLTNQPIGAGMAWLRDLVHIVDGIFYIGYLRPLWESRRRTFADSIMNSVVVTD